MFETRCLKFNFFVGMIFFILSVLVGCSKQSSGSFSPISSIEVTPLNPSVTSGGQLQLTATARYRDGTSGNITSSANWSSSNTSKMTINTSGLASTWSQGSASFTASASGVSSLPSVFTINAIAWGGPRMLGVGGASLSVGGTALDQNKNVYVNGSTNGNLDSQTLTGTTDSFLVKYNSDGVKQWTKLLGVAGQSTQGNVIGVDPNSNIYVSGSTTGNLDSQQTPPGGTTNIFTTKYSSDGTKLWTKLIGTAAGTSAAAALAVDSSSNVYVAGQAQANFDGTGNAAAGGWDAILFKYDSNGNKLWSKSLEGVGGVGLDTLRGLTVDSTNQYLYAVGYTTSAKFNGVDLIGTSSLLLLKFDLSGNLKDTKLYGVGGADTQATEVLLDSSGNIYIYGDTNGAFGGEAYPGGDWDPFIVKLDSRGNVLWTRIFGTTVAGKETSSSNSASSSIDSSGNVYFAGYTSATFDSLSYPSGANYAAFVVKYDSSGNKIWSKIYGNVGGNSFGTGIAVESDGNVFLGGLTNVSILSAVLTGVFDLFIVQIDPNGN